MLLIPGGALTGLLSAVEQRLLYINQQIESYKFGHV